MFFYGYRYCMKKHGITQDTLSFPLDNEDKAIGGSTRGNGNGAIVDPSDGQV